MPGSPGRSHSPGSYGSRGSGSNDGGNVNMQDEDAVADGIPLANLKSNQQSKKEGVFIDTNAAMDDGA